MLCAGQDGGFQRLLRVGCTAERRRRDVRIYELAQQLLRCLFSRVNLWFKELRSTEDIALNSRIFFCRHQLFCMMIRKNRMIFVFCMKRPSKGTHQGGNTGFVIHSVDLHIFIPFLSYVHRQSRLLYLRSQKTD